MAKTKEQLIKSLSKFGDVQVYKEGSVFTLLITGTGLSSTETFLAIHRLVKEIQGRYKNVEVLKNDDTFYLVVLKPVIQMS